MEEVDGDRCPVCSGAIVGISPRRHVATWGALSGPEQTAVLDQIGRALAQGARGFRVSTDHGHFRLRLEGSAPAPLLTTGGSDPLLPLLSRKIDGAAKVDLAVAFAFDSGVRLIEPWLEDLLTRGGALRIVVGDYMNVTEPAALYRLLDLGTSGDLDLRVFETGRGSFHPKAWLFRAADAAGSAIVGSSNLSRTALTQGVEWNLHAEGAADAVSSAFEALWRHPQVRPLDAAWIGDYAARRAMAAPPSALALAGAGPSEPPPQPHAIQRAALRALEAARDAGAHAGLVVLATGLGKTWLAAFDSQPFRRVLFVAHRDEILTQAMATFRRIRPDASFGRYDGTYRDRDAEVLFASIQTLGRPGHLGGFERGAFDYIVVDEFHHAAAATYRSLIGHFAPRFLLGLTATPDRSDGADLMTLCGDRLVFQCDLFDGIEAGLLSPFRYFGVPDAVDYAQIPWRSTQFDPTALEAALATEARAANALDQFMRHRQGPAIGFCCSVRHVEFMAEYFQSAGLRAAAVHSGKTSAPRATSLTQLEHGGLDIIFAVDLFNEGVDIPHVATVLMLRPTESVIVWLQQFGRGLRRLPGKVLQVVDYIGNHRIFLTKVRALLGAGPGDRSLASRIDELAAGTIDLPPGCAVTYDLQVLENLKALLRPLAGSDEVEAQYRDFRYRHGVRPTASEMGRMGFDPSRTGHGLWFDFVRDMGDAVPSAALEANRLLIGRIEQGDTFAADAIAALDAILNDRQPEEGSGPWGFHPAFVETGGAIRVADPHLAELLREIVDWRRSGLTQTARLREPSPTGPRPAGPDVWREYSREDIPGLFGETFNPGKWNAGIVRLPRDLVLLTTLRKGNLSVGGHYDDRFLTPTLMQWQSQNKTRQSDQIGCILRGTTPGYRIHLFVRPTKLRGTKAAPFLYCGQPAFVSWEGESPITITWRLPQPVPTHFHRSLAIPPGG
ncbi:DUF3427 domain-containing protein [Zavarzinia sp. CC-PAN008]|uniref:DUF3427 domain-containing protein n=1 Tax=Zavarzinia sp. CC-PAN008 TaxID=3243332 RepID=UPI003F743C5D